MMKEVYLEMKELSALMSVAVILIQRAHKNMQIESITESERFSILTLIYDTREACANITAHTTHILVAQI